MGLSAAEVGPGEVDVSLILTSVPQLDSMSCLEVGPGGAAAILHGGETFRKPMNSSLPLLVLIGKLLQPVTFKRLDQVGA